MPLLKLGETWVTIELQESFAIAFQCTKDSTH